MTGTIVLWFRTKLGGVFHYMPCCCAFAVYSLWTNKIPSRPTPTYLYGYSLASLYAIARRGCWWWSNHTHQEMNPIEIYFATSISGHIFL